MSQVATQMVNIHDYEEGLVSVPLFQLLQWKHSLRLEMKGLTNSRGSVYKMLLKKLKAPDTYTLEQMSEYITGCVDSINEQLGVS